MTATLQTALPASAQNAPTVHRLPNGLTIIAEQMPIEAVNLNLWLNVGSAVESDDINGMAHFLEHMVFKGTRRLQSGEFERRIETRGAVTNAATSQDYTHYYITTAPKDFAALAPLQIDVVVNPSIPDEAFERERQVVLEEIRRSQDNPRRRTFQHATEVGFERLPYARQVLGPAAVIEQLKPQQMRDFHGQWYQPSEMTAAVVGNLPVEQLIDIVAEGFEQATVAQAGSAARVSALRQPLVAETPFTAIARREVTDPTLQQARLIMIWRVPGLNDLANTYALDVLAAVLGRGRTARLFRDLREERGLVTSIGASNVSYQHQGLFYISAQLPEANLAVVEEAIAAHIQQVQTELITPFELARVRTRTANHFIFGNETPSDRAGLYGYYYSLLGDLAPALNYPTYIRSIEREAVQAAAQRYLSPSAYGVVAIRPEAPTP